MFAALITQNRSAIWSGYNGVKFLMSIRTDIENLAIWYVPVVFITAGMAQFYSDWSVFFPPHVAASESFAILSSILRPLLAISGSIVCGVWLFFMSRKYGGRPALWLLFGLFGHLFSVVLYVLLYVYEQRNLTNCSS